LAKTLLIQTLAEVLDLEFSRIQFTPDLMPSDVTGTDVLEQDPTTGRRSFRFVKGPIFANLLLADEINRTPPKTQAALLQAMQEHQVTASGATHRIQPPFHVFATQNPIEQEGTYPLPEAQLDRFMFKVRITYPSKAEELVVLDRMARLNPELTVEPVLGPQEIADLQRAVDDIYVDLKIKNYVLDIVHSTRRPEEFHLDIGPLIQFGASPRASLYLVRAAKGHAFLDGRGYVTPHDVKAIAHDVLRHRILVSFEAEAEEVTSDAIVQRVLNGVAVP
jgi:MoxR-like ATPase